MVSLKQRRLGRGLRVLCSCRRSSSQRPGEGGLAPAPFSSSCAMALGRHLQEEGVIVGSPPPVWFVLLVQSLVITLEASHELAMVLTELL